MIAFDALARRTGYDDCPYPLEDEEMPSSVREMLAEANAAVPRLNPAEVRDMIGKDDVLIVDKLRLGPGSRIAAEGSG